MLKILPLARLARPRSLPARCERRWCARPAAGAPGAGSCSPRGQIVFQAPSAWRTSTRYCLTMLAGTPPRLPLSGTRAGHPLVLVQVAVKDQAQAADDDRLAPGHRDRVADGAGPGVARLADRADRAHRAGSPRPGLPRSASPGTVRSETLRACPAATGRLPSASPEARRCGWAAETRDRTRTWTHIAAAVPAAWPRRLVVPITRVLERAACVAEMLRPAHIRFGTFLEYRQR